MNINKVISRILYPKLSTAAERSMQQLKRVQEENVFHSGTLTEMLTDAFEYRGSEPNIVLVKDLATGKPAEVLVETSQEKDALGDMIREVYSLWTKDKKTLVGKKDFYIKKLSPRRIAMIHGNMENCCPLYSGVGFRLDQMQIERALQLGIDSIPRVSYPQAILFHTKMGFLPVPTNLVKIKSLSAVKSISEKELGLFIYDIPVENMRSNPFIVRQKDGYYLDVNRTAALSAIDLCKNILEKSIGLGRVLGLDTSGIRMLLKGSELERWRQIIAEHPILSRLTNPPKNPLK